MAQHGKIQYISGYYAAGSAARQLERQPERKKTPPVREAAAPVEKIPLYLDPVAVLGTVVALALLVCMMVGVVQLNRVNAQIGQMEQYITALEAANEELEDRYHAGYDLDEIRQRAEELGMVESWQVRHITVTVPEPVGTTQQEQGWLEHLMETVCGLFA